MALSDCRNTGGMKVPDVDKPSSLAALRQQRDRRAHRQLDQELAVAIHGQSL
ncbi:MAG: hypothetical protein ABJL67_02730 [Sulfitobacter sp.]